MLSQFWKAISVLEGYLSLGRLSQFRKALQCWKAHSVVEVSQLWLSLSLLSVSMIIKVTKISLYFVESSQCMCLYSESTDQCQDRNPCQHLCVDTGVAIECKCFGGYQLNSDERSCSGRSCDTKQIMRQK